MILPRKSQISSQQRPKYPEAVCMKNLLTIVAGLGAALALSACHSPNSNETDSTASASVEATIQPVTFNVTGMT